MGRKQKIRRGQRSKANKNEAKKAVVKAPSTLEGLLNPEWLVKTDLLLVHLSKGDDESAAAESACGCCNDATPPRCYHGSTKEAFENAEYRNAVLDYLQQIKHLPMGAAASGSEGMGQIMMLMFELYDRHQVAWADEEFQKFIFALSACVHIRGADTRHEKLQLEATLRALVRFGIAVRYLYYPVITEGKDYGPGTALFEKMRKRMHDSMTERGMINCIVRETPRSCPCMSGARKQAKNMEKVGFCSGCEHSFPKETMFVCSQCQAVNYCGRACQLKHWKEHKGICKMVCEIGV